MLCRILDGRKAGIMLEIVLDTGDTRLWEPDEYTDYDIKGAFFVVVNGLQWIGMYSLNHVVSVEVVE